MKKKIRIIINPISGTGKQHKAEAALKELLDTNLFDSEIVYTQHPGHFTELAKDAADKAFDAVVIVGGDGSINEAAQSLIGTETALGVIPIGSGNGFARHLNIPLSITKSVECINQFSISKIDTANINDRVFVSISGLGFDAHIAHQFSLANKRGLWNYTKISIREYFRYNKQNYTLSIDDKTINTSAFMLVFANANQFGNNFIISPEAKIDDGLLDICIIQKPKLYQIPNIMIQVFLKKAHLSKLIKIHKAKHIYLDLNKKAYMNIDGEAIEQIGPIEIAINPLSLLVIS